MRPRRHGDGDGHIHIGVQARVMQEGVTFTPDGWVRFAEEKMKRKMSIGHRKNRERIFFFLREREKV